ncbi:IucA/IucC family protein [Facilibium subflavum]|uniref:IucA/IucC family protein n=1 Tax=Facilibium subflavum TaxID=2219058 RepID=UPI000E659B59|nr:IucA/IucC family protein [Facilibium subflavum]
MNQISYTIDAPLSNTYDNKSFSQENSDCIANLHASAALLNCYLREVAQNDYQLVVKKDNPFSCHLQFNLAGYIISACVQKPSYTHFFTLTSPLYAHDAHGVQSQIDYLEFLILINHQLAKIYNTTFNLEFIIQAKNSLQNIIYFLTQPQRNSYINHFISSEQNLIFGHEFHPTPKSRFGIDIKKLLAISPEVSARFQLYYFNIPKSRLKIYHADTKIPKLPDAFIDHGETIDYPLHPAEAEILLNNPDLIQRLQKYNITPIGQKGEYFYPTSSLRTLFHPEDDYFYKCSLHVRLTNCLRKNAVYELESAVVINHIIAQYQQSSSGNTCADVSILAETHAYTLALSKDHAYDQDLQTYFGIILRKNLPKSFQTNTYVALKLFSQSSHQQAPIINLLMENQRIQDIKPKAINWFHSYAHKLVHFIFDYYFNAGIVFEPHLQNVLITIENNNPVHLFIRDLEGTKLCRSKYQPEHFDILSQSAKSACFYMEQQSFNRLVYCLIFNNFATVIHYLSLESFSLEKQLWHRLRTIIATYCNKQDIQQNTFAQQTLNTILTAETLSYKANLITRFLKSADKDATYIRLTNPLIIKD